MKWYRKNKWNWPQNIRTIKEYFSFINYNLLALCLPILIHYSLFSNQTRWIWILLFISLSFLISLEGLKPLSVAIAAITMYFIFILPVLSYQPLPGGKYMIEGRIIKNSEKYFVVSNNKFNILVYKNFIKNTNFEAGQTIKISGNLNHISNINSKIENNFYLSNSVSYVLNKPNIEEIGNLNYSIFRQIKNFYNNEYFFEKYWKIVVFGINDSEFSTLKNINKLNVTHLIVVSGLHFDLLFSFLFAVFCRIFKNQKQVMHSIFIILFFYLCFLNSFISGIRSLIMQFYRVKNKKMNKNKSFEGWVIALLTIFIINFNLIFSIAFIFSFSCSLFIIVFNTIIKKWNIKNLFLKFILFSLFIYVVNLPLVLKINDFFNPFGFILGIIMLPIFEITYLTSVFCFWSPVFLNYFYFALDLLINFLISITFPINIGTKFSWNFVVFCFVIFVCFLLVLNTKQNKKTNICWLYG